MTETADLFGGGTHPPPSAGARVSTGGPSRPCRPSAGRQVSLPKMKRLAHAAGRVSDERAAGAAGRGGRLFTRTLHRLRAGRSPAKRGDDKAAGARAAGAHPAKAPSDAVAGPRLAPAVVPVLCEERQRTRPFLGILSCGTRLGRVRGRFSLWARTHAGFFPRSTSSASVAHGDIPLAPQELGHSCGGSLLVRSTRDKRARARSSCEARALRGCADGGADRRGG
eukprot:gene23601-biopygen13383